MRKLFIKLNQLNLADGVRLLPVLFTKENNLVPIHHIPSQFCFLFLKQPQTVQTALPYRF